jgi:hypothetical protein
MQWQLENDFYFSVFGPKEHKTYICMAKISKPRLLDEAADKGNNSKLVEIADIIQCRSLRLPDTLPAGKVARLIYTNSRADVLALSSNAGGCVMIAIHLARPQKILHRNCGIQRVESL